LLSHQLAEASTGPQDVGGDSNHLQQLQSLLDRALELEVN
jgi:hypothetical protein